MGIIERPEATGVRLLRLENNIDLQGALREEVSLFESAYDAFFYPQNSREKAEIGTKTLFSLDYFMDDKGTFVEFPMGNNTALLPQEMVAGSFEVFIYSDLATWFRPIPIKPDHDITIGLPLSPKVAEAVGTGGFHSTRRHFLLIPENGIGGGVIQVKIAPSEHEPEIGEVWIGRKWQI